MNRKEVKRTQAHAKKKEWVNAFHSIFQRTIYSPPDLMDNFMSHLSVLSRLFDWVLSIKNNGEPETTSNFLARKNSKEFLFVDESNGRRRTSKTAKWNKRLTVIRPTKGPWLLKEAILRPCSVFHSFKTKSSRRDLSNFQLPRILPTFGHETRIFFVTVITWNNFMDRSKVELKSISLSINIDNSIYR